jgi:nucleoside-diphosphate-sugar epimerase
VDLRSPSETKKIFNDHNFDGIIHLAAISGRVGLSGPKYQASLLRDNVLMLFNILDIAAENKIKKILLTLSSGMYSPKFTHAI